MIIACMTIFLCGFFLIIFPAFEPSYINTWTMSTLQCNEIIEERVEEMYGDGHGNCRPRALGAPRARRPRDERERERRRHERQRPACCRHARATLSILRSRRTIG